MSLIAPEPAPDIAPQTVRTAGPALRVVPAPRSLAGVLRDYRLEHDLSFRAAGRLLGASHWVWAQWESGSTPSPYYLHRLADLLDLTTAQARALAGPDRVRRPRSVGEEYSDGLAQARVAAGLSAADLARRVHVSAALVSRWESGERNPGAQYWPLIADALGCSAEAVAALYATRRSPRDLAVVPALRSVRALHGVTQTRLASALGVDVSSIQRWEHSGIAPYRQALRLADALDTDVDTLARPVMAVESVRPAAGPLRILRRSRLLSSRIVAARVGASRTVLLSWERGSTHPSWAQARALADALAVPVRDIFAAVGLEPPRHLNRAHWRVEDLAPVLLELRRWNGLTQQEWGDLAGVTAGTVRAWERSRHRPGRAALRRLDAQLGYVLGDLARTEQSRASQLSE